MPIRKVRPIGQPDRPSGGITLPKEYLQEDGVISRGELEEQYATIEKTDEGEYLISLVDG
jgi:hypothetical protein